MYRSILSMRQWLTRGCWPRQPQRPQRPVLIIVEGPNDAHFLRNISTVLHHEDPALPDLVQWEREGLCVFISAGGGDAADWTLRLAMLSLPEFHLFDRETSDVYKRRQQHVWLLNRRPRCRAVLTSKRALENYLDPVAVREVLGVSILIDDVTNVADRIAQVLWQQRAESSVSWHAVPARSRKRRRDRVKRLLNTQAVLRMTAERLEARDQHSEVYNWLATISNLARRP